MKSKEINNFLRVSTILILALVGIANKGFAQKYTPFTNIINATREKPFSAITITNNAKWKFESDAFITYGSYLYAGTQATPAKYLHISTEKVFHNISKVIVWTLLKNPAEGILKIGNATFQAKEIQYSKGVYEGYWFVFSPNTPIKGNIEIRINTKGNLTNKIILKEIEVTNLMDDKSENAEYIKKNIRQKDNIVQLNRTISKDYWNTLCLPFDVNKASVNLLLNNPELKEFTREVDGTTMKFRNADSIKAGIPYIIKPSKDVVNPTFHNVIVTATEPKTLTDKSGNYSFIGTYSPTELKTDGTELFLGDKDYLYKPFANDKTINGMRAFFRIKNNTSQARQSQYSISIDETTFISLSNINTTPLSTQEKIYTLDGRQVHSTYNLKAGIYIKNGKKLYVH